MENCVWTWILKLCIFTQCLHFCAAQTRNMTDKDCGHGNASSEGPVAGAIVGTISGCVIGFLLGMRFMRFRLNQQKNTQASAVWFSEPMETGCDSSATEESSPARSVSEVYQNASAVRITSNVYDLVTASPDENVYTGLSEKG